MSSSDHLKPGEKGSITARINTDRRGGMTVKTIEVFTNDPDRPRLVLTLKADIRGREWSQLPQLRQSTK